MRKMRIPIAVLVSSSLVLIGGVASQANAGPPTTPAPPANATTLAQALKRGLNMTQDQFVAAGAAAEARTGAVKELSTTQGVQRVYTEGDKVVVVGQGAKAQAAAARAGAKLTTAGLEPKVADAKELAKLYEQYVGNKDLMSVAESKDGFVIKVQSPTTKKNAPAAPRPTRRVDGAKPQMTPNEFGALFSKVKVEAVPGPAKPMAFDISGGFGYETGSGGICSFGYPIFDVQGTRHMLTAGHCLEGINGYPVYARDPSREPALGGSGYARMARYGTVGQASFGRPDMSSYEGAVDFGSIRDIDRGTYYDQPRAFTWQYWGSVAITGTASATVGQPMCRSGRRTGWSCGTISEIGWVAVSNGADTRYVWSAMATGAVAAPGDSGGPWLSGNKVIGIMSASGTDSQGRSIITATPESEMIRFMAWYEPVIWLGWPIMKASDGNTPREWRPGTTVRGFLETQPGDTVPGGTMVIMWIDGEPNWLHVWSDAGFAIDYRPKFRGTHRIDILAFKGRNVTGTQSFYIRDV